MIFIKRLIVIISVIALSLSLVFSSSAAVVQPIASSYQVGYSLNGSTNLYSVTDITTLPYDYDQQLLMNGNNMAVYCDDLYLLSRYVDSNNNSYFFQPSQSYEVNYTFKFHFSGGSQFYQYVDTNLIGIYSYFTDQGLSTYFTNPSSTIQSSSSNFSSSISNVDFDLLTGVLTFDVTLLFKTSSTFSGSFSSIVLRLDLHNFSTAIPSGNSGFFYATLTWSRLSTQAGAVWNVMPGFTGTESSYYWIRYASSNLPVYGAIGVDSVYSANIYDGISCIMKGTPDSNSTAYFQPGYIYQGTFSVRYGSALSQGLAVSSFNFSDLVLSSGPRFLENRDTYVSLYDFSTLSIDVEHTTSADSNTYWYNYTGNFSFTVPSNFQYVYRYFGFCFDVTTGGQSIKVLAPDIRITFDSTGTLVPDMNQDQPGGGSGGNNSEIISGLDGVQGALDSGFAGLGDLINGDGSYGSPDSAYDQEVDNYLDAESDFLDAFGYDSFFNENILEDIKGQVDWDNIDIPDANSSLWFHRSVSPIMVAFPIFIVFPLIIGLIGTLLGRRTRI